MNPLSAQEAGLAAPSDRPFLLVLGPEPEQAARVNSLLRNSGISVHVLHADNPTDAERQMREFRPFMIYFLPGAQVRFPIDEAARKAAKYQAFLGVALGGNGHELFEEAAGIAPSLGIGHEDQLAAIVERLAGLGHAENRREAMRAQEEELEQRLDLLLNSTRDPIAYFHEGLHVAANQAYLDLFDAASLDPLTMVSMLEILEREGTDLKAMIRGFSRGEFPASTRTFQLKTPNGDIRNVELSFAPIRFEGEDCVQMMVRESGAAPAQGQQATMVSEPEPRLAEKAMAAPESPMPADDSARAKTAPGVDPLTGMLWRAEFMTQLEARIQHQSEPPRSGVLFLANDGAAQQLDAMSAADMDRYVQSSANEILNCLEEADLVCRFQDGAFVIHAEREDISQLKRLGERLRVGIEQLGEQHQERPVPRSCSVGLVLVGAHDQGAESTLEKARATCRLAAEDGNRLLRYKPSRLAGVSDDEEAQWIERLRFAIANEDFYTVQHAIMNLDGDLEGLVENRSFLHEDEGDIAAVSYLPAAERNQIASQIDRIVLPGLLSAVHGGEDRLIIDISGNSLQDFSFPAWFQRTLQESRIPGKRVVLQWPAWAAREQIKAARRLTDELSPLGVQFSVSGFDNDPKTIDLLQQLKLQYVTLDAELTRDLENDPQRVDKIRDIIRHAESLQVSTIASDVTTSGDLAILWRSGVKLVSGAFIQETPRVIGQ